MENATDALKIAFAVFVFVIAITVTFSLVAKAKSTADTVLYYSDKTNFYSHANSADHNRQVPVAEVISTIYRYYKESLSVNIIINDGDPTNDREFDLRNAPLTIGQIEADIANYVENVLNELLNNAVDEDGNPQEAVVFTEEFTEVPISGIYDTGEDGTQIVQASGQKKVYITYTYTP